MIHNRPLVFSLFLFALFGLYTYSVFHLPSVFSLDQAVYSSFAQWQNPIWLSFNRTITFLGDWKCLAILAGIGVLLLLFTKRIREGIWYLAGVTVGVFALNPFLKIYFNRPRPAGYNPLDQPESLAYPSGHALGATVFYLITLWIAFQWSPRFLKNRKVFFLTGVLLVLMVGITRLALGVHWLSDVIGGFLLGVVWLCLWLALARRLKLFGASSEP